MIRSRFILVAFLLFTVAAACNKRGGSAPKDFMDGASAVRLGMTEDEVAKTLGSKPTQRSENEQERVVQAHWTVGGKVPGTALAHFRGGPLVSIEFTASLDKVVLPSVAPEVGQQLTHPDVVIKSIEKRLTMGDVLAVTKVPGRLITWSLQRTFDEKLKPVEQVKQVWAWKVEPGGRALLVTETGDTVGQPIIRDLPTR